MKAVAILLLWTVGGALSLNPVPFEVRELGNGTTEMGPGHRIYGGTEALEGEFPFMLFVMMKTSVNIVTCSASLVTPEWVLLAAHCLYIRGLQPRDVIVVGGKANVKQYVQKRVTMDYYQPIAEEIFQLQERRGVQLKINPKYDPELFSHDTALVKVNKAFKLDKLVQTISVAADKITAMKSCTIVGWGLTLGNIQTYKLNFVDNKLISTTSLSCRYKPTGPFICLVPDDRGICQGDSGGPLVCGDKVWGVASHFVARTENPNCGESLEEYYAEASADIDWIRATYNAARATAPVGFEVFLTTVVSTLWVSLKHL